MDANTGKKLYGQIMSIARKDCSRRGSPRLLPGSMIVAARNLYADDATIRFGLPFDTWWTTVHEFGMTSSRPVQNNDTATAETNKTKSIEGMYLDYVWTHEYVPSDDVFNPIWNAREGTLSSIRSRMKKHGFVIQTEGDGYRIVGRPPQKPTNLSHNRPPAKVPVSDPIAEQPIESVAEQPESEAISEPVTVPVPLITPEKVAYFMVAVFKLIPVLDKLMPVLERQAAALEKMAEAWTSEVTPA